MPAPAEIESTILQLATEAGAGHSISPTDAARALIEGDEWRVLMPLVRRSAVKLVLEGKLVITRKGRPVDPGDFKGVYRLSLPSQD